MIRLIPALCISRFSTFPPGLMETEIHGVRSKTLFTYTSLISNQLIDRKPTTNPFSEPL